MHFKLGLYEHQSAGAIQGLLNVLAAQPELLADANAIKRIRITIYEPAFGIIGGRLVVLGLNRIALPQGLHAPFVTTAALVIFGAAQLSHASGFLAV